MTPADTQGPRGSPRWYPEAARQWMDANRPAATSGGGTHGGRRPGAGRPATGEADRKTTQRPTESHSAAQARLASTKADHAALEYARAIGKLHDGEECERVLAEIFGAVSAELESLPRVLAMTALRVLELQPDRQQVLEAAFRDDVDRIRDRLAKPDDAEDPEPEDSALPDSGRGVPEA